MIVEDSILLKAEGIRSNFDILFYLFLSYMTLYKNHSEIFSYSVNTCFKTKFFILNGLYEVRIANKNSKNQYSSAKIISILQIIVDKY